jgi:CheY-like chemotaxis protein
MIQFKSGDESNTEHNPDDSEEHDQHRRPSLPGLHRGIHRKRTHVSLHSESIRIFVVNNEAVIASSLAATLKQHGYSANPFTSSKKALTAARSIAPDLLISDVEMPGLSGVDLAIEIRANCPRCKVLLFSGLTATQDLLKVAAVTAAALTARGSLGCHKKAPGSIRAVPVKSSARILQMPNPGTGWTNPSVLLQLAIKMAEPGLHKYQY